MDDQKSQQSLQDAAARYWMDQGFSPGGVMREVDYEKDASHGLAPELAGIKIVDCDTHFTEPPDLFTSRAPAKFKGRLPYSKQVDGWDRWFIGDINMGAMGGSVIRNDNQKVLGRFGFPTIAESHSGSYQVKPRLQAMDDMGIYAQICYHNSGVTQAGTLMSLGDNELAVTVLSIYNDAALEREEESNQRLFTLGHLPIWDKPAMDAEARRLIDAKIKGFVLPDTPERLGLPSYVDQKYWGEVFGMCNASGTPLNYHLNAAMDPTTLTWKDFSFEQSLAVMSMMFSIGNAATLGNFMVSGLLDTYPELKIGLIESGMGWVPFAIESMEHQFDEMLPNTSKTLQKRPWEYFADHFWVTYWFEKIGPKDLLMKLGEDKVLFETDYPHPTSLYPGVQEHLVDTLGGYDYSVRKKVLQDNAVKLYNLPF